MPFAVVLHSALLIRRLRDLVRILYLVVVSVEVEKSVGAEYEYLAFEFPVVFVRHFAEDGNEGENGFKLNSREVGEDGDALGACDWRERVDASSSLSEVEVEDVWLDVFVLV